MNRKDIFSLIVMCTSCTIIEGYLTDGAYGPTSFSYEKHKRDTLRNLSGSTYTIPYARTQASWIDTLHFFNQGNMYLNTTLNYGSNIPGQIRHLKFRCEPGTEYNYESMTAEILGYLIVRATGIPYSRYLSEKVWTPLGMESDGYVTYDGRRSHTAHAFGGVSLTMNDFAKIGMLYLDKGVWDGRRIVSESWIDASTVYDTDNEGYHYCWYTPLGGLALCKPKKS